MPSRRGGSTGGAPDVPARFVLITECLQNDFFLNKLSPVVLPERTVNSVLLSRRDLGRFPDNEPRRQFASDELERGPLGAFLESTIGRRRNGEDGAGTLHVINIRQWRTSDQLYDEAGRLQVYCEVGTWGAGFIDGLAHYLDPVGGTGPGSYFEEGSLRIHVVEADSPFAFKPPHSELIGYGRKFPSSSLEDLLDLIVLGSDEDQERARRLLQADPRGCALRPLLGEIAVDEENGIVRSTTPVFVGVIGVYTDVHVRALLFGLRDRYELPYLAVSDTLTAAPSLERHVTGLDFAAKLLDVDVIHGINELTRFLGSSPMLANELEVVSSRPFAAYAALDKESQRVIAQQEETFQGYLQLTEARSLRVYRRIESANRFLIAWGTAFLSLTLLLIVVTVVDPGRISPWLPFFTGGLSLVQFVSAFYSNPIDSLQQNLINLAAFRMILESHSLKSSFARLHLTPARIGPVDTADEANRAMQHADVTVRRTEALAQQIQVLNEIDALDYEALKQFSRMQNEAREPTTPDPGVTEPDAPAPDDVG